MNKKIAFLLVTLFMFTICHAQDSYGYEDNDSYQYSEKTWRKKYFNLNFINTKKIQNGDFDLKSNYGASFTIGRTFFLHKKPIANMIKFGIDATWFEMNYTNYQIKYIGYDEESYDFEYQGEISMHVGPSITIQPINNLNVHCYFRYAPSLSILYSGNIYYNYATFFVGGVSAYYRFIGLGIESRFGNCNYKEFGGEDASEEFGEEMPSNKAKFKGWRAYLTFRF